jgi:hypothetical protein
MNDPKAATGAVCRQSAASTALATAFTLSIILLGYVMLGIVPMLLFSFGFLGGLLAWKLIPVTSEFAEIRIPYWVVLGFFVVHKIEERKMDFFPALSQLTGVPVPDTQSVPVFALYALASAWLLIPWLVGRRNAFGYYLAWTFFISMGATEIAHFVFPLFTNRSYGYFPGMLSAVPLVPAAWWGISRLVRSSSVAKT